MAKEVREWVIRSDVARHLMYATNAMLYRQRLLEELPGRWLEWVLDKKWAYREWDSTRMNRIIDSQ